jgi:hypothetical protein
MKDVKIVKTTRVDRDKIASEYDTYKWQIIIRNINKSS